jgi:hypothetical protein
MDHARRKRPPQPGIYTFNSHHTRIKSGRTLSHAITLDLEDEGLHQALALSTSTEGLSNGVHRPRHSSPRSMSHSRPHSAYLDDDMNCGEAEMITSARDVWTEHQSIKIDCDIQLLRSGISFGPNTYLGKGWLYELTQVLRADVETPVPLRYSSHGIELGPAATITDLLESLNSLCNRFPEFVLNSRSDVTLGYLRQLQGLMHALCQQCSWLASQAGAEERTLLEGPVCDAITCTVKAVTESPESSGPITCCFLWFCVEMSVRLRRGLKQVNPGLGINTNSDQSIDLACTFARNLLAQGLKPAMQAIQGCSEDGLDAACAPCFTAESWICLIHLLNSDSFTFPANYHAVPAHAFWHIVRSPIQDKCTGITALEASERVWGTMFSLCALSQFSVHGMTTSTCRLPCCWELVAFALGQIRLSADPEKDRSLQRRSLDGRDSYIRIVTGRCFILWARWHWSLDDASPMFILLIDIFRSRKFANLRHEQSDFPDFMLRHDLRLLSSLKRKDTAFTVFLKLIVQSAQRSADGESRLRVSPNLRKLLSLAVPVGSMPFSRAKPPTVHELSMLFNRFSAIAIAVHLDPTHNTIQKRVNEARRYINFKEADHNTRVTCIRAMMHYACLLNYHRSPLEPALSWLGEMADTLIDESLASASGQPDDMTIQAINLLLGSVRRIILTKVEPSSETEPEYPDPILLEGRKC